MYHHNRATTCDERPITDKPTGEAVTKPPQELEADLNTEQQAEFRRAYLEQLRRMSCPGCGDDPTLPY